MAKWNESIELPGDPKLPAEATTKNYVDSQLATKAPLQSPALTGTPTAPTATTGSNSTQLATTAFVRAQIAADAPTRTGGGASGTWGISITGAAGSAAKLTTARSIALTGGVTGSASFDGSASINISATVANNSHSHTIANVTGLQAKLDDFDQALVDHNHDGRYVSVAETNLGKVGPHSNVKTLNNPQAWSDLPVGYSAFIASASGGMGLESGSPNDGFGYFTKIANRDMAGGWAGLWIDHAATDVYVGRTSTSENFATWTMLWTQANFNPDNKLDKTAAAVSAGKLTAARTITFSGDLSGSMLFDGSSNVTVDVQVANNSHLHAIDNITGLQAALDDKPSKTGSGASGNWPINVTGTSRALLATTNQRAIKPADLTNGRMQAYFVSLTGLNSESTSSDYHDLLVLDTYTDTSGKKINALAFDKATQQIRHFQAVHGASVWGEAKTLAYTDSDITGSAAKLATARTINGVAFDGSQDIEVPAIIPDGSVSISSIAGLQTELDSAVKAGQFGLGGVATKIDNFDTVSTTGIYTNAGTSTVGIPAAVGSLTLHHVEISASYASQLVMRAGADQVWTRRRNSGTWHPWVELHHSGNFNPSSKLDTTATAASATRLATARTIALGGDLSGSASFNGTANITINAEVADNSHAHTIANVTGLQTALNNKANASAPTFTGAASFLQPGTSPAGSFVEINSPGGHPGIIANHSGTHRSDIQFRTGYVFIGASSGSDVPNLGMRIYDDGHLNVSGDITAANGNTVWHAGNFNPDDKLTRTATAVAANKLATARTISLTGNVTGSTTFDGSGNVSISATVAANSHAHTIANVTGLQAALDARVTKDANTLASLKDTSVALGLANGQVLRYQNGTWFNSNIAFADVGGLEDALNAKLDKNASAASATKLATARTINGVAFDGTQNISIEAAFPSTTNPDSFDALTQNGIYHSSINTVGKPSASNYVVALHMSRAANRHAQFAIDTYDSSRAFVRSYGISEAWSSWNELWTSANFDPATKMDTSWRVNAGNGLSGGGDGSAARTITLGTPGTLSGSTTNNVTTSSHTHALSANLSAWDAITPSTKANVSSPSFTGTASFDGTSLRHSSGGTFYIRTAGSVDYYFDGNGNISSPAGTFWNAGNFDPATKMDKSGGTLTGNVTISKNNPWLTLHSPGTGTEGYQQAAGITIGESGYKGAAALHLTYNGYGDGYIGMGAVNENTSIPAHYALKFRYTNNNVEMPGHVTVGGVLNATGLNVQIPGAGYSATQRTSGTANIGYSALNPDGTGWYWGLGPSSDFSIGDGPTLTSTNLVLRVSRDRLQYLGNDVWHSGNLNPASFSFLAPTTITAETGNSSFSSTHTHALTMSYGNDSLTGDELPDSYPNNSVTVTRRGSASGTSWPEHGTVLTANTYSNRTGQLLFGGGGNSLYFRGGGSSWGLWHTVYHTGNLDVGSLVTTGRSISAGNGLSGGGSLAANRTISLGTPGTLSGSTNNSVSSSSHTHALSTNLSAWDGYSPSDSIVYKGNISGSENLNNYTTTGWYHQPANANASSGTNYPVNKAGLLEVYTSGGMVYQRYMEYNSGTIWVRSKYSSTWYAWTQVWDSGTFNPNTKLNVTGDEGVTLKHSGEAYVDLECTASAGRRIRLLSNGTPRTGLYDKTNNRWMMRIEANDDTYFTGKVSTPTLIAPTLSNTTAIDTNGGALRVTTQYGNVTIGPSNTGWAHFNTDRPKFYFGSPIAVKGDILAGTNYNERVWTEADAASFASVSANSYLYCGRGNSTDSSRIYGGGSGNMFIVAGHSGGHIYFRPRGWTSTNQAYIHNNGTFYAKDFQLSSDESLKEDISEIQFNGRLRPVEFTWRENGRRDFGFIAQDVQALYPMAVDEDIPSPTEDEGEIEPKLTLSYSKLTAILSAQLNAAEDRVETLEAELRSVKEGAANMQDQIDDLKELVRKLMAA